MSNKMVFADQSKMRPVSLKHNAKSFDDCPNRCVDGMYVDPYLHKKLRCPYCYDKRRELVTGDAILEGDDTLISKLNLPACLSGDVLVVSSLIPKASMKFLVPETVTDVCQKLEGFYQDITVGVLPESSLLINLGKKSFEANFVSPYMLRAFQAGVSVAPYVTDMDVFEAFNNGKPSIPSLIYIDLIEADLCVVQILASASRDTTFAVKGLMEFRANKGKSTVIVTKAWNSYVRDLILDDDDVEITSKNLAKLVSVDYKKAEDEEPVPPAAPPGWNTPHSFTSSQFNNLKNF